MIRFDELVNKVETLNRQNREQMVQQIMPYIEVMGKKAMFEYEKQREKNEAGQGFSALAASMRMPYESDTSLTPQMQMAHFNIAKEKFKPTQDYRALSEMLGITPAEGHDKWSPERAEQEKKILGKELESREMIDDTFAAYPSVKAKLEKDERFAEMSYRQKAALLSKEMKAVLDVEDFNNWKKKQDYSYQQQINSFYEKLVAKEAAGASEQPFTKEEIKNQKLADNYVHGVMHDGYKVVGYNYNKKDYVEMTYGGTKYRTNGVAYEMLTNKKGWVEIDVSKADRRKKPDKALQKIRSVLAKGLSGYTSAKYGSGLQNTETRQAQPQGQQNDQFDWLFEGVQ